MTTGCEICGAIRNLDRHHVIPRRMGGSKDPAVHDESNLITLCRQCHRNIHDERWRLVRSPEGIRVFDKDSDEQIMRRLYNPDLDVPSLFQLLNLAEDSLSRLFEALPYLNDDQLVEAFTDATSFGKRSWLIRAAILYETQQRSSYGERALESIAWRFGISRSQAWKYALVWKVFFAGDGSEESLNVETFSFGEPSWYVVAATETKEPEKWLAYAQDRKAEDPRYSVAWFRRDIQQARPYEEPLNGNGVDGAEQLVELPTLEHRACPWIKLFCIQSGRPIPVEECRDCEFDRSKFRETHPTKMEA